MAGPGKDVATGVFVFDPGPHVYTLDGVVIPSVSTILAPIKTDFNSIPASVLNKARDRGHAVHFACQLFDEDDLDWDTLDPQIEPYVRGWQKFTAEHDPLWTRIEVSDYHKTMLYAGTPDRKGAFGGKNVVVDIKATFDLSPEVQVQLSGYDLMDEVHADELWSVRLTKDGSYEKKLHKQAHSTFLSCLNIYNWNKRNRK
jgi:hypothetical protein